MHMHGKAPPRKVPHAFQRRLGYRGDDFDLPLCLADDFKGDMDAHWTPVFSNHPAPPHAPDGFQPPTNHHEDPHVPRDPEEPEESDDPAEPIDVNEASQQGGSGTNQNVILPVANANQNVISPVANADRKRWARNLSELTCV